MVRKDLHGVYGIGPTLVDKLDILLTPLDECLAGAFIADTRLTRLLVLMGLGGLRPEYMKVLASNPKVIIQTSLAQQHSALNPNTGPKP